MNVRIVSTGFYAPPRVETAAELAPRLGKSEDWIIQHTGVARRRVSEEPMEAMAAAAAVTGHLADVRELPDTEE